MSGLADLAVSILTQAQRRVEVAGQNLSNATSPAYKRRVAFSSLLAPETRGDVSLTQVSTAIDFRNGKLTRTNNPSDMAIAGEGYFAVRFDDRLVLTRNGQFTIDRDGRLVDARGFALQTVQGADLRVKSSQFTVESDGTVREGEQVAGRIAVYAPPATGAMEPVDGGFRVAGELALLDTPAVSQGSTEAANVSVGDEMVLMMESLRRAESGQRLMSIYDELMGRVITTFGEGAR